MVPGSTLMYGSSFIIVTRRPRASRMAAREAAAMPLPREDTTPPVTKTSGVTEPGEVMGSTGRWKSAFYRFGAPARACRPKNPAPAASPARAATKNAPASRGAGVPGAAARSRAASVLFLLGLNLLLFGLDRLSGGRCRVVAGVHGRGGLAFRGFRLVLGRLGLRLGGGGRGIGGFRRFLRLLGGLFGLRRIGLRLGVGRRSGEGGGDHGGEQDPGLPPGWSAERRLWCFRQSPPTARVAR